MKKATIEQIIAAYQETGTVWKAAKQLGLCGQSVWELLKRHGHQLHGSEWTEEETSEAIALAGSGCSIGDIAKRLGRPYGGVAGKLSTLGVRIQRTRERKVARTTFNTPDHAGRWAFQLSVFGGTLAQFARANALDLDVLVLALQTHESAFWQTYVRDHAVAPPRPCRNCNVEFYPLAMKQQTCTRRCQAHHRADRQYFGGNRGKATGLSEGICQLCLQKRDNLCAHHVLGKENDPGNDYLEALCHGCHQIVGMLGGRPFIESPEGWQRLINLVLMRRLTEHNQASGSAHVGVGSTVEFDWLDEDETDWDSLGVVA